MSIKPSLSIIIPVYNDARNLSVLLASINDNTFKDFELIVVDDGSSDAEVKKIADTNSIRYCRHIENRGVAASRNSGAKIAQTDILVFFDSDVVVEKDTLQRFADGFTNIERRYFQGITHKIPANKGFGSELTALLWYFETLNLENATIYSMCFAMKKDLFIDLNGFDERYTGVGSEEFEFAHRLLKRTPLWTDKTLLLKHNFQNVLGRTLSLFKRSIRYTTMFLFRTKTLDTQVGRPVEIMSAATAVVSTLLILFSGLSSLFGKTNGTFFLFETGILLFFIQVVLNGNFLLYLKNEKNPLFMCCSIPVLFLWAFATGSGICVALVRALGMLLRGKTYHSRSLSAQNIQNRETIPDQKSAMEP